MSELSARSSEPSKLEFSKKDSRASRLGLRRSLERLYSGGELRKQFPDDSYTRADRGMHEFVEGEYVSTSFGDIFVGKVRHPRDHVHGAVPLVSLKEISDDWLSRWGKFTEPKRFDCSKAIFVDAETSGLAGGGGTIAFLIGIGYFYRNQFRIEQFFADSHSREEGMLDLVADFVSPFDTLVTFNGKGFDIPLLETRYLLKRKQTPFGGMDHLDLLHPSRQLWNLTLNNCKLQTIEQDMLRFHRNDDLPGDEVPSAYFRYVRYGDPDPLYRVFQHNADDITSLAALAYTLWHQTQTDSGTMDPTIEFCRGRIFSRNGENKRAIASLRAAISKETSEARRANIQSQLSMLYKSLRDWEHAESVWQEMVEVSIPFYLLPYVELAKYYEHRVKDFHKAKGMVDLALSRISPYRSQEIDELVYRRKRLERKIEKCDR